MNLPDGVRRNIVPLVLAFLGLLLLLFGVYQLLSHMANNSSDVVFEEPSGAPEATTDKIAVDVEGAVIKPGVYEIKSDARMVDAMAAAGGLSQDADRDYVQKNINLAQKITDGLKVYIPRVGEQVLGNSAVGQSVASGGVANSVINVNTASAKDLDTLPGVGAVTAGKIIDGRPYTSVDDLLNRKIVGQATFEKIKDQISAN